MSATILLFLTTVTAFPFECGLAQKILKLQTLIHTTVLMALDTAVCVPTPVNLCTSVRLTAEDDRLQRHLSDIPLTNEMLLRGQSTSFIFRCLHDLSIL
jgi:hypothetical protein